MRAFCLKKLRAKLSYYFGSDIQNFRRTSCKLHDASSTALPVENLKLFDNASTRLKELTIERKPLWISREESDSKAQISDMLKNIDRDISNIFESSERLQLKSEAEELLFYLRSCDYDVDVISNFIASYVFSIPSFGVEHVIARIENLHGVLEILPASSMYEKLILYCCGKDRVEVAIDVVDKMCESGFTLSSHVMQSVLETCSKTDQHYWVFEIYSIISRRPHHFELNGKICRLLVHFCVVMKDFECAYKMINELPKKYFKYKTTMYNAIMAEYVFEKNISGGLRVLKHMRDANVKLDSYTFSFLIGYCRTKEEIKKGVAPPVENLKLLDYALTRLKELTIERKPLWISREESDSKAQISDMFKNIDRDISNIFESSERLQLKSEAEKLLFYLRSCDYDVDVISNFIASYVFSIPSFGVEHVIARIENLHGVLEILPASSMYEKLILYCCGKDRVEVAIDVVDKMCELGFTLSSHVMQSVLETCSETDQHYWVFEIYSIISRRPHHFELNGKICRLLVHFCVVMKDFECAYKMINELPKKYFKYKTTMYNAIMAEYVFEKNISGGLRVLKHMRDANVKPDSYTFSYLIGICRTKEEIKKNYHHITELDVILDKCD